MPEAHIRRVWTGFMSTKSVKTQNNSYCASGISAWIRQRAFLLGDFARRRRQLNYKPAASARPFGARGDRAAVYLDSDLLLASQVFYNAARSSPAS